MNRFNTTRFALSVVLGASALTAVLPAQAQPMMGEMGMHHDEGRMHERMIKHWEKRQTELKAKLHLMPTQEEAWNAFVQSMKQRDEATRMFYKQLNVDQQKVFDAETARAMRGGMGGMGGDMTGGMRRGEGHHAHH